jgi:F-type H+-transporting ATPase subunit b
MATAQNAHTQVPGGKPPFPPFEKETFASQLVWLAIAFIALYLIMARLAIPRIGGIVRAREDRIAGDLAEANSLKEQSDAALKAYEKSLADARARAQTLASEMRQQLSAQAEATRKTLEGQLNAKLAEAEKTISETKTAAMANVRGIAVDAAGAIVERLIGVAPAGKAVEDAVADALKR